MIDLQGRHQIQKVESFILQGPYESINLSDMKTLHNTSVIQAGE